MVQEAVLVLDFGGQYCHLIARRVREAHVYSEIVPSEISASELDEIRKRLDVKCMIFSGGPASIYEKDSPKIDARILDSGIPILGICYGHQLIAHDLKGEVVKAEKMEYGTATAKITGSTSLFYGLGKSEQVWMSHGDTVLRPPEGASITATTDNCPVAAFSDEKRQIYGIQWHPEVVHTANGERLLRNFLFDISKCTASWNPEKLVERYVSEIREGVGSENAIIALSGGIDSSTAAALAAKALGKSLTAVFVDNGLMRQNEPEAIDRMAESLGINYIHVNASERFLKRLEGVTEPERKRKIIGEEFIRVFEEEARKSTAKFLLQGTIYPDRIESGHSKRSSVIKTHHNVGGLPEKMEFKGVVEPLKDLYKDEVRVLATRLGLPPKMVNRQPFPGPGLAVRIVGPASRENVELVRRADAIVTEEIEKVGVAPWQYFAVLTGTMSTGVKGDSRSYGHVVAIRSIESKDAMTAGFSRLPYELLERISTRITNEIGEVVRVVYDVTNKPPSTIEWE